MLSLSKVIVIDLAMKTPLKFLILLITIIFLGSCTFVPEPIDNTQPDNPESDSTQYQAIEPAPTALLSTNPTLPSTPPTRRPEAYPGFPILRGINLGNALEAPWLGYWGVTITEDLIQIVAEAGFNAIRVSVRFSAYTGPGPGYTLSETILQPVDEVIHWGLDAGLIVILDMHHFDSLMQSPATEEDRYLAIWTQLSERYKNLPDTLYFELLNEPSGALDAETWNNLIAKSIPVIRQTNPTRTIIIGGVDYSSIDALEQLVLSDDPHLAATFHYYDPFEFTHQGASWVAGSQKWIGEVWEGMAGEVLVVQQAFDRAVEWSNANQIPLILGEFGVIEKADSANRQAWIATVRQTAEAFCIGWFLWDICSEFGTFNCDMGLWDEMILESLIQ